MRTHVRFWFTINDGFDRDRHIDLLEQPQLDEVFHQSTRVNLVEMQRLGHKPNLKAGADERDAPPLLGIDRDVGTFDFGSERDPHIE